MLVQPTATGLASLAGSVLTLARPDLVDAEDVGDAADGYFLMEVPRPHSVGILVELATAGALAIAGGCGGQSFARDNSQERNIQRSVRDIQRSKKIALSSKN